MADGGAFRGADGGGRPVASRRAATTWMALAGLFALGFLLFAEFYAWWVPVLAALIGWGAAAALQSGSRRAALALICVFVVAVTAPLVGAWAKIVGPFLTALQGGELTFLQLVGTLADMAAAGGGALVCAALAARSYPRDTVERYLSYGVVTVPRLIIGSLILVGIAINFANVVGRYLFLAPIIWAEEVMIYIMVWMVFVGSVLVTWDGHHLKMDFFSIMLPSPAKEIMNFLGAVAFIAACVFVLPQTHTVTNLMNDLDQRSVVAEMPMVIPHFALLLGFVLMFVAVVYRFRRMVTGDLTSEVEELVAGAGQQDGVERRG